MVGCPLPDCCAHIATLHTNGIGAVHTQSAYIMKKKHSCAPPLPLQSDTGTSCTYNRFLCSRCPIIRDHLKPFGAARTLYQNVPKMRAVKKMGRLSRMMRWRQRRSITMATTWWRIHPRHHLMMPGTFTHN